MSEETTMTIRISIALCAAMGLAACADTPTATEDDFGNSVASVVKAQTANPATLSNPSAEPVTGVDPDYASKVIEAMRGSAAKPEEVKQPIEIRVGGQEGS
jgi:type IV pilus biogenesis protein CpaD/CtpE